MGETDGRRKRAQTSRDRIVAAMLALVEEGHITPSADLVAAQAAVGLRTVFRHFADMETLYAAMTTELSRHYDLGVHPFAAEDWRGRLREGAERRIATYETLLPFKRAADAHRHMSPAIQAEHDRVLALMRARLESVLPAELRAQASMVETIDLLLSFDVWQRLRGDQKLPVEQARAIILAEIDRIARDCGVR
ncbi:TetR/AcrR family transcriptional regulator [Sphingomonas psychrolutea]|uniref:Transcriptional regulator n=1 Tax=Sphingomonas psychrolutea TaxID=1259676 RepID=A0ABQ1G7S7_9SPHN|nr:TetR/AcrR family transcriptional regulator [Sphingomonas psychrolutea]GGA38389.1 transcriptional regulator [Sphingomonas psychrolutea]